VRLLAGLLALLVLVEGSGVARAQPGATIDCCCGRHGAHRACKCKGCPVSKARRSGYDHARDCDGNADPGVLAVVAVAAPAPSLLPPRAVARVSVPVGSLSSRVVEAGRPPP